MEELTICTVSFNHEDFVNKNIDLSVRLNQASLSLFRWLVVENTPDLASLPKNQNSPCKVDWVRGEDGKNFPGPSGPGFHHGAAINKALKQVKTRYLLTIDPDFFILMENWVSDVLSRMKERKLAALGAPWNPVWYVKQRYLPACVHCLFLDLEQFDRGRLDFRPGQTLERAKRKRRVPEIIRRSIGNAFNYYQWLWPNRMQIGKERDTGYQIAEILQSAHLNFECFVPVFDPVHDFSGPPFVRYLDRFFGDKRRYIPKDDQYFSKPGFEHWGVESARKIGCEEFLWKEQPFGFHFRGYPKRISGKFHDAKNALFDYLDRRVGISVEL